MELLNLEILLEASRPGGPGALGIQGHLEPAAGQHALIAPAKYTTRDGKATYVFERRFIEGDLRETVLIDSRPSTGNRMEDAIELAIQDGHPLLGKMPSISVTYVGEDGVLQLLHDYSLPHRAWDAHVRLGTVDGVPTTQVPEYRAARNATPGDAGALLDLSPVTVLYGGWDSSRRSHQSRFPAVITGETIGVIDSETGSAYPTKRSGARIDPVGASIQLDASTALALARSQEGEISPKLLQKIAKQKGISSASNLNLGAIPPGTEALDGIATSDIIRSYSLSFASLRRLRFGRGPEGDSAIRALLAALGIVGLVRNNAESYLRANCHLVESGPTELRLDRRQGEFAALRPPTVMEADQLLEDAYAHAAVTAGIDWHGQSLEVTGNPAIVLGAIATEDGSE